MAGPIIGFLVALGHQVWRRGRGIFKLLFAIDDFIRIIAMTFFFGALGWYFHLPKFITIPLILVGIVVDIHDFVYDHQIGRIDLKED